MHQRGHLTSKLHKMTSLLCRCCPNVSALLVLALLTAATIRYSIIVLRDLFASLDSSYQQECVEHHLSGAPAWNDPDLLEVIRKNFLLSPPRIPDTSPVDVNAFVWRDLVGWRNVQETLLDLWRDQPPGTFVEIGAVDGVFMSQTLLLERNLKWTGLLIEPDPRSFARLRESGRNATITDFAILPGWPKPETFWLHNIPPDLPKKLQPIVLARSRLDYEVVQQEINHGRKVFVKCASLSTILLAANMSRIDLLTIATGTSDDRLKIVDVLRGYPGFDVKSLLIQYQRHFLSKNPYPKVTGYIYDMGRSSLLSRLYWRKTNCHRVVESKECKRQNYYDLVEGCSKYLCDGHALVWSF